MTNTQLKHLFNVGFKFLKINANPLTMDIKFDNLTNCEACFIFVNQNIYSFRVNDSWNKNSYTIFEIYKLLSIITHEVRHYWQLHITNNFRLMKEFTRRGGSSNHINEWISFECERDAEAIKYIFMESVLKAEFEDIYCYIGKTPYDKGSKRKIRKYIYKATKNNEFDASAATNELKNLAVFLKTSLINVH